MPTRDSLEDLELNIRQYWHVIRKLSGKWPWIVAQLHSKYGDVVRIAPNELSFSNVESWNKIYGHVSKYGSSFLESPLYDGLGSGRPNIVYARDPEEHRQQRKGLSLGFSAKALREQEHAVQFYVIKFIHGLGKWNASAGGLDMAEAFGWITFDIIGDLTLSESFGAVDTGESHPWVSLLLDLQRDMELISLKSQLSFLKLILPFMLPKNMVENSMKFVRFPKERGRESCAANIETKRHDENRFFQAHARQGQLPTRNIRKQRYGSIAGR